RFIDGGCDADLSMRMSAARMALGWCPAGFVWRCPSSGIREFYRRCIRHGRADAMLAIMHPRRFGIAARRMHSNPAVERRPARVDGNRDGILVRILAVMFSLSGAVAQGLAYRHHIIAADRAPIAVNHTDG